MKSKVHPTYKTQYRVGNWRAYERALVSRGDVTLWFSPHAQAAWRVPPSGRPGGQQRFSDLAITTTLTLRLVFRLPMRQTEGFLRSILTMMRTGLEAPDHTTLSRRRQGLEIAGLRLPPNEPLHLIVDSTGLSVVGEGEWAAAKHGGRGTRGWMKLHLGVDRSGMIVDSRDPGDGHLAGLPARADADAGGPRAAARHPLRLALDVLSTRARGTDGDARGLRVHPESAKG